MKKYNIEKLNADFSNGRITCNEYVTELHTEFFSGRITYNEFVTGLCIAEVGEEKFSNYDLIEGDLYIYCTDDTIKVMKDFY